MLTSITKQSHTSWKPSDKCSWGHGGGVCAQRYLDNCEWGDCTGPCLTPFPPFYTFLFGPNAWGVTGLQWFISKEDDMLRTWFVEILRRTCEHGITLLPWLRVRSHLSVQSFESARSHLSVQSSRIGAFWWTNIVFLELNVSSPVLEGNRPMNHESMLCVHKM